MVKPNSLSGKPKKTAPGRSAAKGKLTKATAKTPASSRTIGPDSPAAAAGGVYRKPTGAESRDTEQRILVAARREFIAKGRDGARMQVIAQDAGVNKALVHYYYRSKEKLYEKVLEETLATLWGRLQIEFRALSENQPANPGVEGIVKAFVSTYIRILSANRDFPLFVFREIAEGGSSFPIVLQELLKNFRDVPITLINALEAEAKAGLIKPVHPVHFIMNMMGMTVITFLAMPLLQRLAPVVGITFEMNDAFYDTRIQSITDTLLNGIRIKR
jgi:TetR/AcrR family transcriptional regulator